MQHFSRFIAPILITCISYFFSANYAGLHNLLRYERDAILQGEMWRIFTGNLTHAGLNHWLVNMLGLWLLWFIYAETRRKQYEILFVLFIASIGTCAGLILFEPQLKWYVGLSGALHGLFAAGIIISFKNEPKIQSLLATLLFTKLLFEQLIGPLPGSEQMITSPVIVNSHLYGAISGLITGALLSLRKPHNIHS